MTSFIFWQRWLFYSSIFLAALAIAFSFFGADPLFDPLNTALAEIFWHSPTIPEHVKPFFAFVRGPLGATIACAYILLACIAHYPFKKKEVWSRNAIVIAFTVWFIIDSAISVYSGVYFQLYLVNTISFLQKALPITFTWKEFKKGDRV